MKRTVVYGLIAALAAALICAAGWGAAWLAGTADGVRWLMDTVSRHTPLEISAREVDGRLLDRLQLAGVRVALAPMEVRMERLDLRWALLGLLSGRVAAKELTMTGVHIRDNTPKETPPDLAWPRASGVARFFDGRIERLRVSGLTYRRLDGPPVNVTTLSSSVAWRNELLSLSDLVAVAPSGRITGSIAAGLSKPFLRFDLAVTPAVPVAGMDGFTLQGRFLPGRSPEQLAGGFTAAGSSDKVKRLELAGEAGMTRKAFNLRLLRLTGPGRLGAVTGGGTVTLTAQEPLLAFQLGAAGLDLTSELNVPTDLSGTLMLTGTPGLYRGEFTLANRGKGWRTARLSGVYQGDSAGVKLAPLNGSLLAGSVQGSLDLRWRDGIFLQGTISGRNLNPDGIDPDWKGVVNFDLAGNGAWSGQSPPRGKVGGRLLESRLHGQALTGELQADFSGSDLRIDRLVLQGKGFTIHAEGELDKRLAFDAQVGDLGRLIPKTAGELRTDGWVRWRDGRLDGSMAGRGKNLAANGLQVASANLAARLGEEKGYPLHIAATLRKVVYEEFQAESVTLEVDGTALRHTVNAVLRSGGAEAEVALLGAYSRGSWQGQIVRFSGHDGVGPWSLEAPAALSVAAGRITLAPLVIAGLQPERLEIAGDLTEAPLDGTVRVAWNGLNLARINPWLPRDLQLDGRLTGQVTGNILTGKRLDLTGKASLARGKIRWQQGNEALDATLHTAELSLGWQGALRGPASESDAGRLVLAGRTGASAVLTIDGRRISLEQVALSLDGNERGMHAKMDLSLTGGGNVKGRFSSPRPAGLAIPGEGEVELEWAGIDLLLIRPWLPRSVNLEGSFAGRATGTLLSGQRLALKGDAALSGGKVRWMRPEGEINGNLRSASLSWDWRGETLRGAVSLALAEQGEARGSFQLPLPARFPAVLDRKGPLQASLTGQAREQGILASLLPGLIQESRGVLDANLQVSGTWEEPKIEGTLKLAKAGAYLPTAGIHVKDVQLAMHLEKELVRIDSFRALSGPGHIEGTALVRLKGWQVADYRGSINGERFQTVHLPELQMLSSPNLTFEGAPGKLNIRGEVLLPELLIFGQRTREVVLPSRDVILEGAPKPVEKSPPLALDIQIRMVLGERVLVKADGIDAKLGGSIDLVSRSLDHITSRGEIRVVKGRYKAYGAELEIIRGRLFYTGGPINRPTLDILALRTVGDVRAGVTAGGILRAPVIKLYSEPAMPDGDILAYIVFGRPLGSGNSSEQAAMMAQVAGALLSQGQSVSLQEQIKNRLGLSTLEIQTTGEASGRMGYKPIPVAPAGVAPARQEADISQTILAVGKYLTPQLYFSYGRSLFSGGNLFRLRYDIFKQWQIETQTGSESGVDLYYKIDFN